MFDCVRCFLFCTFLILTAKSAFGFWPFSDNSPTTPTLKFYPEPPDADQNTLIYFKYLHPESSQTHVDSIKRLLSSYKDTEHRNSVYCSFDSPPPPNKFCTFNLQELDDCSTQDFGFNRGTPCIFLTITKVDNWIPTTFNESDIVDISDSNRTDTNLTMPKKLRDYILEQTEKHRIWVSCNGDTVVDKEFVGPIEYYPNQGFPAFYFPFTNVEGYQSPIIAVHFRRPQRNIVIGIECKIWAKNIKIDQEKQIGYTKFFLLVD